MPDGFFGQLGQSDVTSDASIMDFFARQAIGEHLSVLPCVVKAVHGGGVGAPPTVDVQITVKQMDAQGNTTSHGTIFGLPVMRLQSGSCSLIVDPVAGDYGLLVFADRDISAVKANKGKESQPGSFRRGSMSDGIYVGGLFNQATPTTYVQVGSDKVKIVGKTSVDIEDTNSNKIQMTSSGINLNGVIIDSSGNISTPGGVTAGAGGADSVTLQNHTHTSAASGSPTSAPIAGT